MWEKLLLARRAWRIAVPMLPLDGEDSIAWSDELGWC